MLTNFCVSENERIAVLQDYEILDTPPSRAFDDLARLASLICETPIALVSLVDTDRQWFKARVGLDLTETARDQSFCQYAIQSPELMIVPDVMLDDRFRGSLLVMGEPHIRFYAGMPLRTESGCLLGTICVIDQRPRDLNANQRSALAALGRLAVDQLELHRQAIELNRSEQRFRLNEERLTLAVEGTIDGIWDWNFLTDEAYYSPRCLELITDGQVFEPKIGAWKRRLHPDDHAATMQALAAHLDQRVPYDVEFRLRTESRGYRWFRVRGQARWDEAGRPVSTLR